MKLNTFFLMGATAITLASGAANAEEATAQVIWNGLIGSSVPGDNLIITGQGGGDISSGTLFVEQDGTFTSTEVILEARDYDAEAIVDPVGERQPEASWTYVGSQVIVGGTITEDADVRVRDNISGTYFTQGSIDELKGAILALSIKNEAPVTDVAVEGVAQVSVQMSASYVDGL